MDYIEAVDYITKLSKFGSDFGLKRMEELLGLLGNPQESLKFVHVAGTNGKGSTVAFLNSILCEANLKVGCYISPSVYSYNERYSICKNNISNDELASLLTKVKNIAGTMENKPTAFEIETAVAMLYFLNNKCDICILETGLGGRLDATNVVKNKEVAIICEIGFDHVQVLGNTLAEIATEKLAIANGCPLCTIRQKAEIMPLFEKYNNLIVAEDFHFLSGNLLGQRFAFKGKEYFIKMLGAHQIENASLSITAANVLRQKGYNISDEDIEKGLSKTLWKGRFEVVKHGENVVIFDGAHNADGANALCQAIEDYLEGEKIGGLVASFKDKDYNYTIGKFSKVFNEIVAVDTKGDRSLKKEEIKKIASCPVTTAESLIEGLKKLLNRYKTVVICGTLSILGDAERALEEI